MKSKILGLLTVGLLVGPISVGAAPITYDFTASNFQVIGGPNNPVPFDPISGSYTLDGLTLVGFQLSIGSKVYGLSDVGIIFGGASGLIGGLLNGVSAIQGSTDDFVVGFGSSGFTQAAYSVLGTGTVWFTRTGTVTQRAAVPEPGTLALLGLGLAGLGLSRRRKAN